jgi:hypothetical protein
MKYSNNPRICIENRSMVFIGNENKIVHKVSYYQARSIHVYFLSLYRKGIVFVRNVHT